MGTNELTTKIRNLKELQIFIKQLEEEAEGVKAEIIAEMNARQADTITVDVFTVKYTAYQSSRLDTTALKKAMPELAERFTKTTEARRFQIV